MSGNASDPLAEAHRLEAEAMEKGEESDAGRELRAKAAELRVQALGPRSYSVLVCQGCFVVTGWLGNEKRCDGCLRREQFQAAYRDSRGGWVSVADTRAAPRPASRPSVPAVGRLLGLKHPREAHRRALVHAWMTHVKPDETGPIAPEDGYQIELAWREEVEAADGSGMLIRFHTASARFAGGAWDELQTTRIPRRELLVPAEFSAVTATEELVEAWEDYKAAVDAFNGKCWDALSAEREGRRQADAAHEDAMREQRGVLDLLDEN